MATPPRSITLTTEEIKHLELIQAVVTRLANGSFLIKGWTMTVAGIFFGLAANNWSWKIATTGIIPIVGFWLLDSYYLRQERLFRKLYDDVRKSDPSVEPFSMNVGPYHQQVSWGRVIHSHTMVNFYGTLFLVASAFAIGSAIKSSHGH
ncbi:hypothetical protein OG586_13970 [Streptomyces murinus]|uniref:hypothetical protein n=1 Tax=Streptomyces murinus TaxID=33900 RepID=UPI002E81B66A|nr:hypothetical protein [Streptomyces murinus]WUD07272.1 hypothetical protein OG586_13970 [Streptomyces murinus]